MSASSPMYSIECFSLVTLRVMTTWVLNGSNLQGLSFLQELAWSGVHLFVHLLIILSSTVCQTLGWVEGTKERTILTS